MKKFLSVFLAITVIFSFAAFAVGSSSDNDEAKVTDSEGTSTQDAKTENGNLRVNVGEVLETDKVKITYVSNGEYKDSEYSPPSEGYEIIYIEVKVENLTDSNIFVSQGNFDCYADNEAMSAPFLGERLYTDISSGRFASGKVFFEVPISAKKIEVEYTKDSQGRKNPVFVVK